MAAGEGGQECPSRSGEGERGHGSGHGPSAAFRSTRGPARAGSLLLPAAAAALASAAAAPTGDPVHS